VRGDGTLDPTEFYSLLRRVLRLSTTEVADDAIAAMFHGIFYLFSSFLPFFVLKT